MIDKVSRIGGVEKTAPSIRLAGQVELAGSKTDVVVVGATNDYMRLGNIQVMIGSDFSSKSDKRFLGAKDLENKIEISRGDKIPEVAGIKSDEELIKQGDETGEKEVSFRIRENSFTPIYSWPKTTGFVEGYGQGSITKIYKGVIVWGGVYDDSSGQGRVITPDGQVMGKWLKSEFQLYEKIDGGIYLPKTVEAGQQEIEGYISFADVRILSAEEEMVEDIIDQGMVLGITESSPSAEEDIEAVNQIAVGTNSSQLSKVIASEPSVEEETEKVSLSIWEDSAKEVIVSQGLVRAWDKEEKDVIGTEINVQYLVTNSLVPSINSRILTEETNYKVVGVFRELDKPVIYVPLGDVESLGIERYSTVKVLVEKEDQLPEARILLQSMGLSTKSVSDTLGQINRLFSIVRFLLGSFGAIAFVVALFGMFNTLTVSLLERTREIGVMKSLGTTNSDVSRIFLTESFLISLFGSVLGVLAGGMLGKMIDRGIFHFSQKTGHSLFVLPLSFGLFIIGISVLIGLFTGWYPAKRSTKISALNAIRYE
jgi:hypothetical protein